MLVMLRTAFLVYVRVLLFAQGGYLAFLGVLLVTGQGSYDTLWGSIVTFLGLAGIVTAVLLWRGRRWVAVAAILIEGLWAATAVAFVLKPGVTGVRGTLALQLLALAALFLVTIIGLLLRPVRAYTGLVRGRLSQASQR
jgi:hypothetical protein